MANSPTAPSAVDRARIGLLRVVLRTPLHRTVSRRFVLLREVGGTTLDPAAPLRYAVHEGVVIVMGKPWADWWRPLSSEPTPCTVIRQGQTVQMVATSASGAELDEAVLRYLQKYPGEWKALGVDPSATADDVETAARGQAVITFRDAS